MANESFEGASVHELIELAMAYCSLAAIEDALRQPEPRTSLTALLSDTDQADLGRRLDHLTRIMASPGENSRGQGYSVILPASPDRDRSAQAVELSEPRGKRMTSLKHISQATLDSRVAPPAHDSFDHEGLARKLYAQFADASRGTVIAIDAPWGRGKSDVLHRVARHHNEMWDGVDERGQKVEANLLTNPLRALWITPWLTKDSNLLGEIVLECMKRAHQAREADEGAYTRIRELSEFIIYASLGLSGSYAQGNLANYLQARHLFGANKNKLPSSHEQAKTLVDQIFNVFEDKSDEALETTPQIFARIVNQLLRLTPGMKQEGARDRLLIFIDDIDRCLPHQQVELLEAIHFLTTADAPVIFFMAIDSELASKALATHYKIRDNDFAPLLYLDKIIDARVALSAAPLFRAHFKGLMQIRDATELITLEERTKALLNHEGATGKSDEDLGYDAWEDDAVGSIRGPRNLNPRAWQKIFGVFRIALRDREERVLTWITRPETFWPWACLRVRHYSIAQRVMAFFGQWETNLPGQQHLANSYAEFVTGLGLGLERYIDRTTLGGDGDGEVIDGASMQIASLLAACGLFQRPEAEGVVSFMENEYEVIKAFERSCERQGLGSVMHHAPPF